MRNKKIVRIATAVLTAVLTLQCLGGFSPVAAQEVESATHSAADSKQVDQSTVERALSNTPYWDPEDPMNYRIYEKRFGDLDDEQMETYNDETDVAANYAVTTWGGNTYTHCNNPRNGSISVGVDVSKWNSTADWAAVKNAGISFAMIRIGYSGLTNGSRNADPLFSTHYTNAKAQGLQVGVYYFSEAISLSTAKAEANYVISLLKGYDLDLPVVMDYENFGSSDLISKAHLTKSQTTDIVKMFCDTVKAAGYDVWVYGNSSMLADGMDGEKMQENYGVWMAKYASKSYNGKYYGGQVEMWQCSETAKVSGLTGSVDLNYMYSKDCDPVETVKNASLSLNQSARTETALTVKWNSVAGADGYEVYFCESANGTYILKHKVVNPACTIKELKSDRQYYVRVRAYTVTEDGKTVYSKFSSLLPVTTKQTSVMRYKANRQLTMHTWAGESFAVRAYIPAGTVMTRVNYTRASDNTIWYRITCNVKGKTYDGYVAPGGFSYFINTVTGVKQTACTTTSITLSWNKVSEADSYLVYRSSARNGTYTKIGVLSGNTSTSFVDKNRTAGVEYYYKVYAKRVYNATTTMTAPGSAIAVLHTTRNYTLNVQTTYALNVRQYAGTAYAKVVTVPKGKKLAVYYKTKDNAGVTWYKIKYTVNGKSYVGYISSKYTKRV